MIPARHIHVGVASVTVLLGAGSLGLALRDPLAGEGPAPPYLDALGEPTLPTWWSTTLLVAIALSYAAAGIAARAADAPGGTSWFVGAAVLGLLSLTEHSGLHERLDGLGRQLFGTGPLTESWLLLGAVAGMVTVGILLVTASRVGAPARRPLEIGAVLLVGSALGGELAMRVQSDQDAPGRMDVLVYHVAEVGEGIGALLLLAAATRSLVLTRQRDVLRLRYVRETGREQPSASSARPVPIRRRPAWTMLIGASLLLIAVSLVVVLNAPVLEPAFREWRLYLDVLVESNLPTWWSSALLAIGAMAHALAGVAARLAKTSGSNYWFTSATILGMLSLDDHTQLHERTEQIGRLVAEDGNYPFYWLLPGAVAGLAVTAAVIMLAARVGGRSRWLLVAGIVVLLGCALGLEVVQGFYMAEGNEGTGFALTYHAEELGENIGALLLLGAATSALSLTKENGTMGLRYACTDSARLARGGRCGDLITRRVAPRSRGHRRSGRR